MKSVWSTIHLLLFVINQSFCHPLRSNAVKLIVTWRLNYESEQQHLQSSVRLNLTQGGFDLKGTNVATKESDPVHIDMEDAETDKVASEAQMNFEDHSARDTQEGTEQHLQSRGFCCCIPVVYMNKKKKEVHDFGGRRFTRNGEMLPLGQDRPLSGYPPPLGYPPSLGPAPSWLPPPKPGYAGCREKGRKFAQSAFGVIDAFADHKEQRHHKALVQQQAQQQQQQQQQQRQQQQQQQRRQQSKPQFNRAQKLRSLSNSSLIGLNRYEIHRDHEYDSMSHDDGSPNGKYSHRNSKESPPQQRDIGKSSSKMIIPKSTSSGSKASPKRSPRKWYKPSSWLKRGNGVKLRQNVAESSVSQTEQETL